MVVLAHPKPHLHVATDHCPLCEQPIPNDRLDAVQARSRQMRADADARVQAEVRAQVEMLKAQFATREEAARKDGETRAAEGFQKQVSDALEAKKAAAAKLVEMEALKAETENKMAALQAAQEETLKARLAEARDAMEKAKTEAVNAERVKNFDEKLKLEALVADLQRKLQNKTVDELGEGAEVDLFETLKAEFPNDDIQRVGRGNAGADIIHKVRHNGATCGTIVYDSKNHKQWRNDFVSKLRQDQIAAKADHAVLATHVFPKDCKQLHIDSGVILANPARAVVVATILRQQVLQVYCLKVSNEERASKTDELYAFMTSERFGQFLSAVNRATEQLEALQAAEKKAHENHWKKQGELYRTVVRTCAQFDEEIARIIGTAPLADAS